MSPVESENRQELYLARELRSRLQVNLFWNLIAVGFSQGSTFLIQLLIARIMGRASYGEYAIIYVTLFSLATIAQLATGYTVTRYLAEYRSLDKARAGRIMGLCSAVSTATASLAALALLGGAPELAASVLKAPHITTSLMIGAAYLFFSVINGYQMGALSGLESYAVLARGGIASSSVTLAACVSGSYFWGLQGAVAGLSVGSFLGFLVYHYLLKIESRRHEISISYRGLAEEVNLLTKFAFPATLSGIVMMVGTWLGNTILVRQPNGYNEFALYSAAMGLRVISMFFPRISFTVINSLLSNQLGQRDGYSYHRTFWFNIILSGVSVLVSGLFIVLLGRQLLGFFGKSFVEGYPVLIILMIAAPLEALALATYQLIQTFERMWLSLFGIRVPNYLVFLALAYFLSPGLGARGLALAFTLGWATNLGATVLWTWKYGLHLQGKAMRPSAASVPGV